MDDVGKPMSDVLAAVRGEFGSDMLTTEVENAAIPAEYPVGTGMTDNCNMEKDQQNNYVEAHNNKLGYYSYGKESLKPVVSSLSCWSNLSSAAAMCSPMSTVRNQFQPVGESQEMSNGNVSLTNQSQGAELNYIRITTSNQGQATSVGDFISARNMTGLNSTRNVEGLNSAGNVGGLNSAGNVGGLISAGNVGGLNSAGNVGGLNSAGDVGGLNSAGNVGGLISGSNVGGLNSTRNVGGLNSAGNVGGLNSAGNVGGLNSVGNLGCLNSAGNVGGLNSAGNVGCLNSAGNVGCLNSAGNVGGLNSGSNVGGLNSTRNVGCLINTKNLVGLNSAGNVGGLNSAGNVGGLNSAGNVGGLNSAGNVEGLNTGSNVGGLNSAGNVGGLNSVSSNIPRRPHVNVCLADINAFNTICDKSTLFERLHSTYEAHLSRLNYMYVTSNSTMAKSNTTACVDNIAKAVVSNDTGQKNVPSSSNQVPEIQTTIPGERNTFPLDNGMSHSKHSEDYFRTSVSNSGIMPFESVSDSAFSVPSPISDRPMGFRALNGDDQNDTYKQTSGTREADKLSETYERSRVDSQLQQHGQKREEEAEEDDEDSISDTEVQPEPDTPLRHLLRGPQQTAFDEDSVSDTEVQPEPGCQLRRLLLGLEQTTFEERMQNFLSDSSTTMTAPESSSDIGASFSFKRDTDHVNHPASERLSGEGLAEPGSMATTGITQTFQRPPLRKTSPAADCENIYQNQTDAANTYTSQLPYVNQDFWQGKGIVSPLTTGSDNVDTMNGPSSSGVTSLNAMNGPPRVDRLNSLLACRPNFSPVYKTHTSTHMAKTQSTNVFKDSGGSCIVSQSERPIPYTFTGLLSSCPVSSASGPELTRLGNNPRTIYQREPQADMCQPANSECRTWAAGNHRGNYSSLCGVDTQTEHSGSKGPTYTGGFQERMTDTGHVVCVIGQGPEFTGVQRHSSVGDRGSTSSSSKVIVEQMPFSSAIPDFNYMPESDRNTTTAQYTESSVITPSKGELLEVSSVANNNCSVRNEKCGSATEKGQIVVQNKVMTNNFDGDLYNKQKARKVDDETVKLYKEKRKCNNVREKRGTSRTEPHFTNEMDALIRHMNYAVQGLVSGERRRETSKLEDMLLASDSNSADINANHTSPFMSGQEGEQKTVCNSTGVISGNRCPLPEQWTDDNCREMKGFTQHSATCNNDNINTVVSGVCSGGGNKPGKTSISNHKTRTKLTLKCSNKQDTRVKRKQKELCSNIKHRGLPDKAADLYSINYDHKDPSIREQIVQDNNNTSQSRVLCQLKSGAARTGKKKKCERKKRSKGPQTPLYSINYVNTSSNDATTDVPVLTKSENISVDKKQKKRQRPKMRPTPADVDVPGATMDSSTAVYKCYTDCPPPAAGDTTAADLDSIPTRKRIRCVISKKRVTHTTNAAAAPMPDKKVGAKLDVYDFDKQQQPQQNESLMWENERLVEIVDDGPRSRRSSPVCVAGTLAGDDVSTVSNVESSVSLGKDQRKELADEALRRKCAVSLCRQTVDLWYRGGDTTKDTANGCTPKITYCTSGEKEYGQSFTTINTPGIVCKGNKFTSANKKQKRLSTDQGLPGRQVQTSNKEGEIDAERSRQELVTDVELLNEKLYTGNETQTSQTLHNDKNILEQTGVAVLLKTSTELKGNLSLLEVCHNSEADTFSSLTMPQSPIPNKEQQVNSAPHVYLPEENADYVYEGVSEEFHLEQMGESGRLTPAEPPVPSLNTKTAIPHLGHTVSPLSEALHDSIASSNTVDTQLASSPVQQHPTEGMEVTSHEKSSDPENHLILLTSNMRKKNRKNKSSTKGSVSSSASDKGSHSSRSKKNGFLKVVLKKPRLVVENTPLPSPTSSTNSAMLSEGSTDIKSFLPEPFAEPRMVCGGNPNPSASPFVSSSTEEVCDDYSPFCKTQSPPNKLVVQRKLAEESVMSTRSGRLVKRSIPEIKETILESSFASVVLLGKQFQFSTGRMPARQYYGLCENNSVAKDIAAPQSALVAVKGSKKGRKGRKTKAQNRVAVPSEVTPLTDGVPRTGILNTSLYKLANGETVGAGHGFSWDHPQQQVNQHPMNTLSTAADCNISSLEKKGEPIEVRSLSQDTCSQSVSKPLTSAMDRSMDSCQVSDINLSQDCSAMQASLPVSSESSNIVQVNNTDSIESNNTDSIESEKSAVCSKKRRKPQSSVYRKRRRLKSVNHKALATVDSRELRVQTERIDKVSETKDFVIHFIDNVTAQLKPTIGHQRIPDNCLRNLQSNATSIQPTSSAYAGHKTLVKEKEGHGLSGKPQEPEKEPDLTKQVEDPQDSQTKKVIPTTPAQDRNIFADIGDITALSKDLEKHSISDESMIEKKEDPHNRLWFESHQESAPCPVSSKFLDISSDPDYESEDEDPVVEHHVYSKAQFPQTFGMVKSNPFAPKSWACHNKVGPFTEDTALKLTSVLNTKIDHDHGNDADTETDTEMEQQNLSVSSSKKVGDLYREHGIDHDTHREMCHDNGSDHVTHKEMCHENGSDHDTRREMCHDNGSDHDTHREMCHDNGSDHDTHNENQSVSSELNVNKVKDRKDSDVKVVQQKKPYGIKKKRLKEVDAISTTQHYPDTDADELPSSKGVTHAEGKDNELLSMKDKNVEDRLFNNEPCSIGTSVEVKVQQLDNSDQRESCVDANQNEKLSSELFDEPAPDIDVELKEPSPELNTETVSGEQNLESPDHKTAEPDQVEENVDIVKLPRSPTAAALTESDPNCTQTDECSDKGDSSYEHVVDLTLSDSCNESDKQTEQIATCDTAVPCVNKKAVACQKHLKHCNGDMTTRKSYGIQNATVCETSPTVQWHIVKEDQTTDKQVVNLAYSSETSACKQSKKDFPYSNQDKLTNQVNKSCVASAFISSVVHPPCNALVTNNCIETNAELFTESALDLSQKGPNISPPKDHSISSFKPIVSSFLFPIIDSKMAKKATNVVKSLQEIQISESSVSACISPLSFRDTNSFIPLETTETKIHAETSTDESLVNQHGSNRVLSSEKLNEAKHSTCNTELFPMQTDLLGVSQADSREQTNSTQFPEYRQLEHKHLHRVDNTAVNLVKSEVGSSATLFTSKTTAPLDSSNKSLAAHENMSHPVKSVFRVLCGSESGCGSVQKDLCKLVGVVTPRQFVNESDGDDVSGLDTGEEEEEEDPDDPMLEQMIFAYDLLKPVGDERFECLLCGGGGGVGGGHHGGQSFPSVMATIQHVLETHCYCHLCAQGYPEVYAYQGHIWSQHPDDEELIRNARKLAKFRSSPSSVIPTPPKLRRCYTQGDTIPSTYTCKLCGKTTDTVAKARSHVSKSHFKKAYWWVRRRNRCSVKD